MVLENKNCRERIKTVAGALGGFSFHLLRLLWLTPFAGPKPKTRNMLLKIQKDESLRSYVERNKYVDSDSPFAELLKGRYCYWDSNEVKLIAKFLGLDGCYGFNKLLHNHTHAPWFRVFKPSSRLTYSESHYVMNSGKFDDLTIGRSYCPLCVREDIEELGYSYWRRLHHKVTVCAKHNVTLLSKCQFCGKPFARGGHAVHVMWSGCLGRHLGDAEPEVNADPAALRLAQFYRELCALPHHVSTEVALLVTKERLTKLIEAAGPDILVFEEMGGDGYYIATESAVRETHSGYEDIMVWIEVVALTFESFDEFLKDCALHEPNPEPIDSCWNAYNVPSTGSRVYVQEDYSFGVAIWSDTDPSKDFNNPLNMELRLYHRPVTYPCCNLPIPRRPKGHQLQPTRVGEALPQVPRLGGASCASPPSRSTYQSSPFHDARFS